MPKINSIMICGDDPRVPSGVGSQIRYIGKGLNNKGYDVIVVGGTRKRDKNDNKPTQWEGMKIYPVEGYGKPVMIRNIITIEQPDTIMLFTDPRYWVNVWMIEDEIRTQIPIIYYNLWDDSPVHPNHYNKNYYKSNDALLQISKQTNVFINNILKEDEEVELVKTQRYQKVIDSANKNAGMLISRQANEGKNE